MVFFPSLEGHYHQEFNFSDNNETTGCCAGICGYFRSKPKEFYLNEDYIFEQRKKMDYNERIESNIRLCELIKYKLNPNDPTQANRMFERLKLKIHDDLMEHDPISSEKLAKVINAIYSLKQEVEFANKDTAHKKKKKRKKNPSL